MESYHNFKTIKESYEQLKTQIVEHVRRRQIITDVITDLKNSFQTEINSRRRSSCIDSIEDLISVLEKRDVLNVFEVNVLEKIIRTIGADKSKYLSHCELISSGTMRLPVNNINVEEDYNQIQPTEGIYH